MQSANRFPCLRIACLLCSAAISQIDVFAASSASNPNSPTFAPGILIAWFICNARKRSPIGGWLFFFYWQLYSGLLISAALFSTNIENYVPENFDDSHLYRLFVVSSVPCLVLFAVKCAVGTILLSVRTWDMLRLLRWVMGVELAVVGISAVIDALYFPDNLPLTFLVFVPGLLWLMYFFRSERVRHIFLLQNWDVAVNSIYPLKLKLAT